MKSNQGNATQSPLAAYTASWSQLITKEHEADKALVSGRLASWPLEKLQQEGLALLGLTAARSGRMHGVPLWVLQRADRAALPMHRFTAGDEVLISKGDIAHSTGQPWKGVVTSASAVEMRLTSKSQLPTDGAELRLDKGVNTVVYKRMRTALKSLKRTPPTQQQLQQALAAVTIAINEPASEGEHDSSESDGGYETDEDDTLWNSWPLLITTQLQQQWQQKSQKDRAQRKKLARRETKLQQREQQRQRRRRQQVQQLKQQLHMLQQQRQHHGTCLASLLICPSCAAAAGPSDVMPAAAVQWAQGVVAQHIPNEQHQSGSNGSGSAAASAGMRVPAEQGGELELGLNSSQLVAVANSICNKLSLIHGPPGTGKTTTTVALIAQLVKRWELPFPVLAVAQSNVAVDNLLEGLTDAGVNAVRLGQPIKVRESLRGATLDALLEAHPRTQKVEGSLARLRGVPKKHKRHGENAAAALAARASGNKAELMAEVLSKAQVICATCAAAGSDVLADASFPVVVLDEASQASEPEALIAITRGAEHVVLVGDHCQLPPVCISEEAAAAGLSISLFERLMAAGVPSAMLQVQYRMHPCLSAFPNTAFYRGQLRDGISAQQRPSPQPFPWPQPGMPLVFIDVPHGVEQVDASGSKLNRAEAAVVQQVLTHFVHVCGESRSNLAVVVPYLAQLNLLDKQLAAIKKGSTTGPAGCSRLPQQQWQQRDAIDTISTAAASSAAAAAKQGTFNGSNLNVSSSGAGVADVLEIRTVDGYQGREKQVVVFNAVRANPRAQVGFLEDWRRLNVAITRPMRGLVLIGHAATLSKGSETWGRYLAWLLQNGCVVGAHQMHQQMAASAAAVARRAHQHY